jgi:hypothetical protein
VAAVRHWKISKFSHPCPFMKLPLSGVSFRFRQMDHSFPGDIPEK